MVTAPELVCAFRKVNIMAVLSFVFHSTAREVQTVLWQRHNVKKLMMNTAANRGTLTAKMLFHTSDMILQIYCTGDSEFMGITVSQSNSLHVKVLFSQVA